MREVYIVANPKRNAGITAMLIDSGYNHVATRQAGSRRKVLGANLQEAAHKSGKSNEPSISIVSVHVTLLRSCLKSNKLASTSR